MKIVLLSALAISAAISFEACTSCGVNGTHNLGGYNDSASMNSSSTTTTPAPADTSAMKASSGSNNGGGASGGGTGVKVENVQGGKEQVPVPADNAQRPVTEQVKVSKHGGAEDVNSGARTHGGGTPSTGRETNGSNDVSGH